MSNWSLKQKINPYLAILLILMVGLVFTLLIWTSINQPGEVIVDQRAAVIEQ